ncbi:group 1 glycosyl transferase [Acidipropionibacterium jensenii]|uniref:Group 1 glycosyl transferase n=1 Tax=Acidipropionibacterium jensenii TaxID=1749 RepID=A0A3T0S2E4_9ACTN|nr:glycosyltransferase [Acidipropionibacterium jensenii]AZZ40503.1 group 1 glycosyl transferase [Acidipropionibacterium jensenii]
MSRAVVFMPTLRAGGGAERYAVSVVTALRSVGYDCTLAHQGEVTQEWVETQFGTDLAEVRLDRLPDLPPACSKLPDAMKSLIRDTVWHRHVRLLDADVFVNCLFRSEMPGAGRQNIYVCHFPHRLSIEYQGALRRLYMLAMNAARCLMLNGGGGFLNSYDTVCANSQFTAHHIRRRWGVEPVVVPPACPDVQVDGIAKEKLIIAVGRIEPVVPGVPNKRLDVLIDTFAAMTDLHRRGWRLVIAGSCRPESHDVFAGLERRAEGAPIQILPNRPYSELKRLYSSASIYWHAQGYGEDATARPETQEHFGITTVEAMSAGCIPVVIDTAGPREVSEGVDGAALWRTPDELVARTAAIAALDETQRAAIAERCRARAHSYDEQHFRDRFGRVSEDCRVVSR